VTHFLFLERNMHPIAVAKTAIGARNIGQALAQKATPDATITKARYIGLRVNLKGPDVTSLRFAVEVGLISVPSRRKSTTAAAANVIPNTMSTTASQTSGKPGICGHPAK
jgi:hypothetical protein